MDADHMTFVDQMKFIIKYIVIGTDNCKKFFKSLI